MARPGADPLPILETLRAYRVDFILVGGVAAVVEGAPVATFDLDVVPDRAPANLRRLCAALSALDARYRMRRDIAVRPTPEALAGAGHPLLLTRHGPLDVLGVIGAGRDFVALVPHARRRRLGRYVVRVLDLETQIAVKEELGHLKDRAVLPILRETLRLSRATRRRR